jgi:hypothetical protein
MAKYIVEIERVTYAYATLELEAESESAARDEAYALCDAGDVEYDVGDVTDEIIDSYPAEESPFASDL